MKNECSTLYLRRKSGEGMKGRYILSHYSPALIVFLIVLLLTFVMVFISSMTSAIDRMIVLLGCGSIETDQDVDVSMYDGAVIDEVKTADGIIYASSGKSLVHLKGVNIESYFSGERREGMKLEEDDGEYKNGIIISSSLASLLSLSIGERMTVLLYESENGRGRPVLMTVSGIYSSGYAQLDRYLAFVDITLADGDSTYEILLKKGDDVREVVNTLRKDGVNAVSYKTKYASLCLNVDQSIMILYVILVFVALLAAFFSSDIAHIYTSRDRKDIAFLRLMGMSEKEVRRIYRKMTINTVFISSVLGLLSGLILSLFSPAMIELVALKEPEIVEYYISSFTLSIPWSSLLIMLVLMILCSSLTLRVELWRTRGIELGKELRGQ